jgi:small subunit ribosomal protein S15
MARLYSGRKGKSGSKRVDPSATTTWVKYSAQEIEKLILKEAKEGLNASQIGLRLRDTYGVPSTELLCGKKINEILLENNITKKFPEDLMALFTRAVYCQNHLKKHKHDNTAKRGLTLTKSKINRLVKYYKSRGIIDDAFRFNIEEAKLLIE